MRRVKILVPLPEIGAEDEHDATDRARQMLAERDWLDWQVTEVGYSIVEAPDGWHVVLHEIGDSFGPFVTQERAAGIADYVFNRMGKQ